MYETAREQSTIEYQLAHINDNLSPIGYAFNITLTILATVAIVLRQVSKKIAGSKFMIDDAFILLASVGLTLLHVFEERLATIPPGAPLDPKCPQRN